MRQPILKTMRNLIGVFALLAGAAWAAEPPKAGEGGGASAAIYYGFAAGTGTIFVEIANGKAIIFVRCDGVVEAQVNPNLNSDRNGRIVINRFCRCLPPPASDGEKPPRLVPPAHAAVKGLPQLSWKTT